MMKIVIASDSFKGTLSSLAICQLFRDELSSSPSLEATYLPIADGGEGSLDAIAYSLKGHFINLQTINPHFKDIETHYFVSETNIAYIEAASSAGLTLITDLNPSITTTFGLGQQILDAIKRGCHKIYVFLGGSATNDGGCGLFSALGTKFYNANNEEFIPTGGTLKNIVTVDNSLTAKYLHGVEISGLCDVNNPLYGPKGAAYVYAAQKGADQKMIVELDEGLKNLSLVINKDLGIDVSNISGSGAAGGLGAGIFAFARGTLMSGIETILDFMDFNEKIKDADYIISGEGRLDEQSFYGKVIKGIASRCQALNKKLLLIVGSTNVSLAEAKKMFPCIGEIIETNPQHLALSEIIPQASEMYQRAIRKLLSTLSDFSSVLFL